MDAPSSWTPLIYKFHIGGRHYKATPEQTLAVVKHYYNRLVGQYNNELHFYKDLVQINGEQPFVAFTTHIMGPTLPSSYEFHYIHRFCFPALRDSIRKGWAYQALCYYMDTSHRVHALHKALMTYNDHTIHGAEVAIDVLTFTKEAAKAGVTAIAGTLSGGNAYVAGAVNAGYGGLLNVVGQNAEVRNHLRDKIDFSAIAFESAVSGLLTLAGGKLTDYIAETPYAQGLINKIGITNAKRVIGVFIGRFGGLFKAAAMTVFNSARNRGNTTWDELTKSVAEEFAKSIKEEFSKINNVNEVLGGVAADNNFGLK